MEWNEPTELKFDVAAISSMRNKLQSTSDELSNLSATLLGEVEALKAKWKTPAGEVFVEKFDTGWVTQVNQYINIINAVDELLEVAETHYSTVEDAANAVKF